MDLKVAFFLSFSLAVHETLTSIIKKREIQKNIQEFPVCPPDYPSAFQDGAACCDFHANLNRSRTECSNWVVCPADKLATGCEDFENKCLWYHGGAFGAHGFNDDLDGVYVSKVLSHNRPVYFNDNGKGCIWWHSEVRYWWIGSCENVGTNEGFAYYMGTDMACPTTFFDEKSGLWTIASTNIPSSGSTSSFADGEFGTTSGTDGVITGNKWRQVCKWLIRPGTPPKCEDLK